MNEIPMKHCHICDRDLPATADLFNRERKMSDGLQSQCKECIHKKNAVYRERRRQAKQQQCAAVPPAAVLPASEVQQRQQPDTDLSAAVVAGNDQQQDYPDEEPLADHCESCGTTRGNILGDIDKVTHERYGSICMPCYRLLRESAADARRMRNVLTYIERTRIHHV